MFVERLIRLPGSDPLCYGEANPHGGQPQRYLQCDVSQPGCNLALAHQGNRFQAKGGEGREAPSNPTRRKARVSGLSN